MVLKTTIEKPEFDESFWLQTKGLTNNPNILLRDPTDKVFCREDYAQDLYDRYHQATNVMKNVPHGGKDVEKGQFLPITDVSSVSENEIYFEVNNMTAIPVNVNKEKKFFEHYGTTKEQFIDWVRLPKGRKEFLDEGHLLYIEKSHPNPVGSLLEGLQNNIKNEFLAQIAKPTHAYPAKVMSKNQGGFLIDVQGIQAFLPGGLAAANKIVNFDAYIGKTVYVMVEDYLTDIDTFIFSNKKYVQYILPKMVADFDLTIRHTGNVTGTSRHGVFVEFEEVFTGLLHTSKMNADTKVAFDNGEFHPGDAIECWVLEITRNNQLVLSDFEPGSEENGENAKLEDGKTYKAVLTGIKDFGIFVKLATGEIGLIPSKSPNNYLHRVGDEKEVRLRNTRDGKYYFEFPKEDIK